MRAPDVATHCEDLAITLNNQGMARWSIGEIGAAERSFQEALGLLQPLAERQPRDAALQSRMGGIHNNLGMTLEQAERTEEALAAYTSAAAELELAYQLEPHVFDYRAFLSKAYGNLGRSLRAASRHDEAVKVAWKRRDLWPGQPERLFAVAEELALAHAGLPPDQADDCARKVVATLEEASSAGYPLPSDLDRRAPFASLDHYPAFLALVKQ
jgi:tetratricopeptide (TPR) repeat protein